jgi:plasmid stability protein
MPQLLIPDVETAIWEQLRERASRHGRTVETEAKAILTQALRPAEADPWSAVDAIRQRLAATGRDFSDSVELLREDRQR